MAQYEANIQSVEQHCKDARGAHGLSSEECLARKDTVQSFPTIAPGL
jgi:hypothetical protein